MIEKTNPMHPKRMKRILLWSIVVVLVVFGGWGWSLNFTKNATPAGLFPTATPVSSVVTVGEILHGREIQRMEVIKNRSFVFGPVCLNAEVAKMLSLLASPEAVSEASASLLALEDNGPVVQIWLNDGKTLFSRRIADDCYRIYWDEKTAWFRLTKSANR